ncbi:hypothetical protein CRENBAI_003406 [Crenichthys baileyi]|uniref:Uncharacterized protein n=1 Tax=Crenichthys baileyi TaxID=28760 RepID=A0AAV9QXD1_9TELE
MPLDAFPGGVPGTSHREEAQGTAQDTLEGLCLSAGLVTPWAPPGGAGGGVWGEGRLGVSAESAAPATRFRISGRRRIWPVSNSQAELPPVSTWVWGTLGSPEGQWEGCDPRRPPAQSQGVGVLVSQRD